MSHNVSAFASLRLIKSEADVNTLIYQQYSSDEEINDDSSQSDDSGSDFEFPVTDESGPLAVIDSTIIQNKDENLSQLNESKPVKVSKSPKSLKSNRPLLKSINYIDNNDDSIALSNYIPNGDNVIFEDDSVTIALKVGQSIIFKGQFSLIVLKGAITVNNIIYDSSPNKVYDIYQPISNSLSIIYSAQGSNKSNAIVDMPTDNYHFFNASKFVTIIKVKNLFTGLETSNEFLFPFMNDIFYSPSFLLKSFKNYSNSNNSSDKNNNGSDNSEFNLINNNPFLKSFLGYSFIPILYSWQSKRSSSNYLSTISISNSMLDSINSLTNFYNQINFISIVPKVLVIGSKNSGKSTFLLNLLNHFLHSEISISTENPVSILDIDPGQPIFSYIDSLSYSTHHSPIIGLSNLSYNLSDDLLLKNEYFGFNSPLDNLSRYYYLIKNLFDYYNKEHYNLDIPLLINTPGYIKGYGFEILNKIVSIINPTHIVYFSNESGKNEGNYELEEFFKENCTENHDKQEKQVTDHRGLSSINIPNLSRILRVNGIFLSSNNKCKITSTQYRTFKLASYFHKIKEKSFNFEPLIFNSPYKISYYSDFSKSINQFQGIFGYSLLNDFGINVEENCSNLILDGSVSSIYCVSNQSITDSFNYFIKKKNEPINIPSSFFQLDSHDLSTVLFLGLAAVHSINIEKKYINIYMPNELIERIKCISEEKKFQFVLIKGRTELSSHEICPRILIDKRNQELENKKVSSIPFISWDTNPGKGGKIWKPRKNVQRRGQS
ncbi:polynucleotide 5'-hydroxyl-kinase ASCRUDRAFT_9761 [Ascoidea rubescens DSM 1968]|uniref:Polynucleotide 5'-hydroxyl-kinase GRC3 n=1 Tax=Ascoidea rubescens DSM 1968 TaxID=1344418 RepID=A0A1D2VBD5_9ASCO|nr:hypothetical protein ASCRUDRAFT_9761 [Ascoidea rubescens DSM 1968]ODV59004.1 hypothetical protein ASCRUDRAFT_9761 [Ascoidea rubescens DSM 1968]